MCDLFRRRVSYVFVLKCLILVHDERHLRDFRYHCTCLLLRMSYGPVRGIELVAIIREISLKSVVLNPLFPIISHYGHKGSSILQYEMLKGLSALRKILSRLY